MRSDILSEAIGMVGDDLITDADAKPVKNMSRLYGVRVLAAIAACLIITVCAVPLLINMFNAPNGPVDPSYPPTDDAGYEKPEESDAYEKGSTGYEDIQIYCDSTMKVDGTMTIEVLLRTHNVRILHGPIEFQIGSYEGGTFNPDPTDAFIFNGECGYYYEDIESDAEEPSLQYSKLTTVEISCNDLAEHRSGFIKTFFGEVEKDPTGRSKPSFGAGVTLYYVVSDDTIGFSFESAEDAAKNINAPIKRISGKPPIGICCPDLLRKEAEEY